MLLPTPHQTASDHMEVLASQMVQSKLIRRSRSSLAQIKKVAQRRVRKVNWHKEHQAHRKWKFQRAMLLNWRIMVQIWDKIWIIIIIKRDLQNKEKAELNKARWIITTETHHAYLMARQRSIQISIQTMSVESQRLIFITREKLQLLNKAIMDKTRDQSWVSKMQLKLSRERQVSKTKQLIWESTSTRIKVEISKERKFHSKLNKIILSHKIWSNLRTYQMDS